MSQHPFLFPLILFLVATLLVARSMWTRPSVGLGGAYMLQLWMLYAAGPCLRALPWSGLPDTSVVLDGFAASAYGAMAFAIGWFLTPQLFPLQRPRFVVQDAKLPVTYLVAGMISYFLLRPTIGHLPSVQSLTAVGSQLAVAGLCLGSFVQWKRGGWRTMLKWVVPALLLPVITVLHEGFLGFGVAALSLVFVFCAMFVRPRWVVVAALLIAAYAGMSVMVAYLENRTELRTAVWGGADLDTRLTALARTASLLHPFDPTDPHEIAIIDGRLDQSILAGLAVDRISERGDYAHGATLLNALIGVIPRALWPNKPAAAGSGGLVSRYTGIKFARNTSVGVGQVMEFYINFGMPSLIIGFFALGVLLGYSDQRSALLLHTGDWQRFVQWFLIGISCINVGGSLIEVTSTAAASVVTAQVVNSILAARKRAVQRKTASETNVLQPV